MIRIFTLSSFWVVCEEVLLMFLRVNFFLILANFDIWISWFIPLVCFVCLVIFIIFSLHLDLDVYFWLVSTILVWLLGIISGVLDSSLSFSISMFSSLVTLYLFLLIPRLDLFFGSIVSHWWLVFMFIFIILHCSLFICGRFYWWVRVMRYTDMSMIFRVGEQFSVLGLTWDDGQVFHLYIFYVMKCLYGIINFLISSVLWIFCCYFIWCSLRNVFLDYYLVLLYIVCSVFGVALELGLPIVCYFWFGVLGSLSVYPWSIPLF